VGATILLVDDEAEIREPLTQLLTSAGYDVVAARNGIEALSRARTRPISAVVTDLSMPVMDGRTLIEELRGRPELAGVPIFVITGSSAAGLSGVACFEKPLEVPAFLGKLHETVRS
jgi:two-component system, chemotaxis family, chemotaxis protein CheY